MIRGLIFDINGTVTDILTDEGCGEIYRVLSNFLDYQGISLSPDSVRQLYFDLNKRQRRESKEEFPEFDVVEIFREIVETYATGFTHSLPKARRKVLPEMLAEVFRAASRFKLQLYPGVREVLDVRMFESMLVEMNLTPAEVIFIGNDMYRDVFGANRLGIKTVFFKSNQGEQRKSGAEPDYIIYDFRQLPEAVRFLEARA